MEMLMQMFSYPFIVRAFIVGILVSLCAALLGVSLVLKQYSMIGDGLSHVSYGALSIAIACGIAPLALSIPVVIVAAFFLLRMTENGLMKSDAAIAAMSASALAIGVSVTSLTTGMTTDVCSYMFGSILAMTSADVYLSVGLSVRNRNSICSLAYGQFHLSINRCILVIDTRCCRSGIPIPQIELIGSCIQPL